jgi:hypothetical protein
MPPLSDDALLSTAELSAAFAEMNLPLAVATLVTRRSLGNGPAFLKYGKWVRYRWGTARDWRLAQGRCLTSTSQNAQRESVAAQDGEAA